MFLIPSALSRSGVLQGRLELNFIVKPPPKDGSKDRVKPTPAETLQVAALPVVKGEGGARRVVMVTTLGTGRWTLPKGNLMAGLAPHRAAAQEALEEAGLIGRVKKKSIGSYSYWKRLDSFWVLATVMVFPMVVERRATTFKESGMRLIEEFDFFEAEENVYEPGLKAIIRAYGERKLQLLPAQDQD